MNESRARIERIRRINKRSMYLEIAVEDKQIKQIKPGEALLVRFVEEDTLIETWSPYLREQWWVAGVTAEGLLLIERPFSHHYRPQQVLSVLAPLGQAYRFRKTLRNVLLIAYDSLPIPLTIMLSQLLHNRISVTLVLLGSARDYETTHLSPEIEVIRGEETFAWQEQVMTLGWADMIFAVVSQDDELAHFAEIFRVLKEKRNEIPPHYVFGVFQQALPCGVGACGACLVRVKNELMPICTAGPAFDLTEVKLPL